MRATITLRRFYDSENDEYVVLANSSITNGNIAVASYETFKDSDSGANYIVPVGFRPVRSTGAFDSTNMTYNGRYLELVGNFLFNKETNTIQAPYNSYGNSTVGNFMNYFICDYTG